jgi:hypothetical protein
MKNLSLALLLLSVLAGPTLRAAAPVGAPQWKVTRARIEALFRLRNAPLPAPDPRLNPFRLASDPPIAAPAETEGAGPGGEPTPPDAVPLSPDEALLTQAVATLKLNGAVQIGDRMLAIINQATYKEGDLLSVRLQGKPVDLNVRHISSRSVTIGLNEAELTLQFSRPAK